jgi:hypothetical protein
MNAAKRRSSFSNNRTRLELSAALQKFAGGEDALPMLDESCSSHTTQNSYYSTLSALYNSTSSIKGVVTFDDQVKIIEIPTLDEYTNEELDQLYYSREEQREMREDVVAAANGWDVKGQEEPRGLENLVKANAQAVDRRYGDLIRSIRHTQRLVGYSPTYGADEMLAECSRKLTKKAREQAYTRGQNDEKAAAYSANPVVAAFMLLFGSS